ncbi:MAG: nucleotidyl transferase AbiEii/AbiGii toxin family protein [Deltaproteobacteria bacterium]|nr:nucleotidyl transferase AbiEii/AbiGii toxin family protein [Deltaproteobacteria bacterium]
MNDAIAAMLARYGPIRHLQDEDNALREIIQHLALLGLHRGGFFEKASFYGGTALRILYNLSRFSEDMDFCLATPDENFSFVPYLKFIEHELARYGFSATVEEKRAGPDVAIGSAFVKQDTIAGLLVIDRKRRGPRGQLIKVRLEVDKRNPPGSARVRKLVKLPVPFLVGTLDEPSLFAGKVHALLARAYLNRVKGRDYYDFLFYSARDTPINMRYLEAKLRDSGHYRDSEELSVELLIEMLVHKFQSVDFEKARDDVRPLIKADEVRSLDDWEPALFTDIARELRAKESIDVAL